LIGKNLLLFSRTKNQKTNKKLLIFQLKWIFIFHLFYFYCLVAVECALSKYQYWKIIPHMSLYNAQNTFNHCCTKLLAFLYTLILSISCCISPSHTQICGMPASDRFSMEMSLSCVQNRLPECTQVWRGFFFFLGGGGRQRLFLTAFFAKDAGGGCWCCHPLKKWVCRAEL
jgi:hypothetical protein